MSTSRSLVVSDREACSSWTWLASELVVLLPLVGFARFGVAAAVALLPWLAFFDLRVPLYFQWLGWSWHCQSKTEWPALLQAGHFNSVGCVQLCLECCLEHNAHLGAALQAACLWPYLLQLKHGRLSSRRSYFEQYAPVAPKMAVPFRRR